MDRREFCQTVALAATVYAAGDAAHAQTSTGFKVLGINHFSYTCPDYTKPRDFFTSVFGLEIARDTGQRANLMFGPEPGKGGTFMIVRNPVNNNRPTPQAVIDGRARALQGPLDRGFAGVEHLGHLAGAKRERIVEHERRTLAGRQVL